MKLPLAACWALAALAVGRATAPGPNARALRSTTTDKAQAFLIDIERGVRKVSEDAKLTFSALDTYGSQLEMSTETAAGGSRNATAEHETKVATSVHELRELEEKIRQHYAGELARVKQDAENLGRQLAGLQAETSRLKTEKADAQAAIKQLEHRAQVCEQSLRQAQQNRPAEDATEAEAAEVVAKKELVRVKDDETQISKLKADLQKEGTDKQDLEARLGAIASTPGAAAPGDQRSAALEREVVDLKKTEAGLKADKEALVKTVQHVMNTNQTLTLKQQEDDFNQAKVTMQKSFDERIAAMQQKVTEAESKLEDEAEVVKTLQEQGLEVEQKKAKMEKEVGVLQSQNTNLVADKSHLLDTLRGVLRSNTQYQQELTQAELDKAKEPHKEKQKAATTQAPQATFDIEHIGETAKMDRYMHKLERDSPAAALAGEATEQQAAEPQPAEAKPQPPATPPTAPVMKAAIAPREAPRARLGSTRLQKYLAGANERDPEAEVEKTVDASPKDNPDGKFGDEVDKLLNQAESAVSEADDSTVVPLGSP